MDVGGRLGSGAGGQGVLAVIQDLDIDAQLFLQAALDGVDGAVSNALKLLFHSMVRVGDHSHGGKISGGLEIRNLAFFEVVRLLPVQIIFPKLLHDLLGGHLSLPLGDLLDHVGEFLMHAPGQLEAKEGIHDKGHAALSGLAVDPDDGFVFPADIRRVDGEIRHLPYLALTLQERMHALVDGVLVGAGEGGEHQLSGIGMAGIDVHFRTPLIHLRDPFYIGDLQLRVDALGEHIISQGQDIHISGPLAVSEQSALHPVRTCQERQLCGRHSGSPVVVGMDA